MINLELIRQRLELIGTVRTLDEQHDCLYISINHTIPSISNVLAFISVYNDEIYSTYNTEDAITCEGTSIKAIFSNKLENISTKTEFVIS